MINKTYQFYGNTGTLSIGFIDGVPYIGGSPILDNPTEKRKFNYDKKHSPFFVFNKLEDIVYIIELLSFMVSNINMNSDLHDEKVYYKKFNGNNPIQIMTFTLDIVENDVSSYVITLDDKDKNGPVSIDFKSYGEELKILKRFFELSLDNYINNTFTNPISSNEPKSKEIPKEKYSYKYMKDRTPLKSESKPDYVSEDDFDSYMDN
jgi:hypothetical protein